MENRNPNADVNATTSTNINTIKLGIYRHFRGNEYQVIGIARNSETLEPMVVYKALYADQDLWVRPLSMFSETVIHEGSSVQRFSFVCP